MVRDRLLQAVAGLLLASLVGLRVWDGSSLSLVQSWYGPILAISVVVLLALSATVLIASVRSSGRWRPPRTPMALFSSALVLVPVILAFGFQPKPLGSASLQSSDSTPRTFGQSVGSAEPAQRNVYQWAYELASSDPAGLVGQPVDVIGFVYHPKDAAPDRFAVARFVVACCVADATGYKLPVQWGAQAALKSDGWVRVHGAIRTASDGTLVVDASAVDVVDAPANPYIYP